MISATVERELSSGHQRRVVLLVDDCRDTRELYAEYLELSGFDVKEASDGMLALEEANRLVPDVIILDMSLPGLNGGEAARRLRADARTSGIPLVVVSGYDPDRVPGGPAPWDAYLGKPCAPDDLVRTIERLVDRRG